jgi:hypothetical protein
MPNFSEKHTASIFSPEDGDSTRITTSLQILGCRYVLIWERKRRRHFRFGLWENEFQMGHLDCLIQCLNLVQTQFYVLPFWAMKLTTCMMRSNTKEQPGSDMKEAVNCRHSRATGISDNASGILSPYFIFFVSPESQLNQKLLTALR